MLCGSTTACSARKTNVHCCNPTAQTDYNTKMEKALAQSTMRMAAGPAFRARLRNLREIRPSSLNDACRCFAATAASNVLCSNVVARRQRGACISPGRLLSNLLHVRLQLRVLFLNDRTAFPLQVSKRLSALLDRALADWTNQRVAVKRSADYFSQSHVERTIHDESVEQHGKLL